MKLRILVLLALLIPVSAAHGQSNLFFSDEVLVANFNKHNDVQVHVGGVKKKHKVLGKLRVTLQKGHPQYNYVGLGDVMRALTEQARALGGHAIIRFKYVEVPFGLLSWGSFTGTATAIRYHGRPPAKKKTKTKKRKPSSGIGIDR